MKKTNFLLVTANILTGLAFLVHAFVGDSEINQIKPALNAIDWANKQEIWTMARCGWHWISFDLLMATVALTLLNFTNYFENRKIILQLLSLFFFGYAIVWIFLIILSDSFSNNFLKLGQWILLLSISALIYYGAKKQETES